MAGAAVGAQAAAPPGGDGPASLEERGQDHDKIRAREAIEEPSSEGPAPLEGRGQDDQQTHDSGRIPDTTVLELEQRRRRQAQVHWRRRRRRRCCRLGAGQDAAQGGAAVVTRPFRSGPDFQVISFKSEARRTGLGAGGPGIRAGPGRAGQFWTCGCRDDACGSRGPESESARARGPVHDSEGGPRT